MQDITRWVQKEGTVFRNVLYNVVSTKLQGKLCCSHFKFSEVSALSGGYFY